MSDRHLVRTFLPNGVYLSNKISKSCQHSTTDTLTDCLCLFSSGMLLSCFLLSIFKVRGWIILVDARIPLAEQGRCDWGVNIICILKEKNIIYGIIQDRSPQFVTMVLNVGLLSSVPVYIILFSLDHEFPLTFTPLCNSQP